MNRSYVILTVVLFVPALGLGLTIASTTPSTGIPFGTATTYGSSMGDPGTMLVYVRVPYGMVSEGDVIVYRPSGADEYPDVGEFTAHRVIDRTESGLETKGDAVNHSDQTLGIDYVDRDAYVGVVVFEV